MEVLRPTALVDALAARAAHPEALAIAGGTDVMVELNFDKARPPTILDLTSVPELGRVDRAVGAVRIGAGVPFTRVIEELGDALPALVQASRTIGSPQIRNRGTIGGNLGTASPAG
ncbi:MAG TPA: FAD binding domain-containing protein, partial [Solirubrobacteraceae bacterium]|nr:FAD binding domain-containing protein [Solirubrobacteraceae bacterium]